MNLIEQNIILYYADFLSLKHESIPVTDNCKYYYIHNTPINSAYIVDKQPFYDEENKYYVQASIEYQAIKDKFGEEGTESFVESICNLGALGCINAKQMLDCIHQYSDKSTRKRAKKTYNDWLNNQVYTHLTVDDDDEDSIKRTRCSKYVARVEQGTDKQPQYENVRHTK